jgi:hypothetical protein
MSCHEQTLKIQIKWSQSSVGKNVVAAAQGTAKKRYSPINVMKLVVRDAHDKAALAKFFSKLVATDHLVSRVGDSMAGGFLTTSPEIGCYVLHLKF